MPLELNQNEYGESSEMPLTDSEGTTTVGIRTHAKEELPTFRIAATGALLMVIFVDGVFVRVWDPNQSIIARTEVWPPN